MERAQHGKATRGVVPVPRHRSSTIALKFRNKNISRSNTAVSKAPTESITVQRELKSLKYLHLRDRSDRSCSFTVFLCRTETECRGTASSDCDCDLFADNLVKRTRSTSRTLTNH